MKNLTLRIAYSNVEFINPPEYIFLDLSDENIETPKYIILDLSDEDIEVIKTYCSYVKNNIRANYICMNWEDIKFLNQENKECKFDYDVCHLRIYKEGFLVYIQNAQDSSIQIESEFYSKNSL